MASNVTGFGSSPVPLVVLDLPNKDIISKDYNGSSKKEETEKIEKAITVEEYIRNYFSDIPIMVEIAKCESRFRQHDTNGETLRGVENNLDRGVMQINEYYHLEDSGKFGYDILTIEGNTAYARHLFEKYGVQPWSSSSKCWSKTVAYSQYQELAMK